MIQENINLKQHNTFGIEVNAHRFATFSSIEELRSLLSEKNDDSLLILGGGSNILFTKDFNGLVIKNEIKGFDVRVRHSEIQKVMKADVFRRYENEIRHPRWHHRNR